MNDLNIMWTPDAYQDASILAREVGSDLIDRLAFMTHTPRVILDAGCGTGELGQQLRQRYPKAKIISLDNHFSMIQFARSITGKLGGICGDAHTLPLRARCVDFIFANFLLPWTYPLSSIVQEWHRVMKPGGMIMFSALGPDTFKEWHNELKSENLPFLYDMHDLGDLMMQCGFVDPVLDVDHYTLNYQNESMLLKECQQSGFLIGDQIALPKQTVYPVTFEVIFGHAFSSFPAKGYHMDKSGEAKIPLSSLRDRLPR